MKNTKVCTKCQSADTVVAHGAPGGNAVAISMFRVTRISRHICCACGYVEEFIHDNEKLKIIRERYQQ